MYEQELESDKSDKGLYEAEDDYGTTYYYRGNVTNNYIKFGGFYWRVVRINGDGSTRLLYAGTVADAKGSLLGIGNVKFNETKNNPTYVGYMYSNTLNTSYLDTIKNDNNSTIKTSLDEWYKTNIEDKGYSKYLADSGFCNDRSLSLSSIGTGATASETSSYASSYRYANNQPAFTCSNISNDLFTLNANAVGNNKLTYPIGLITLDELIYAGLSKGLLNKMNYTYSSQTYWTMSPANYIKDYTTSHEWAAHVDGSVGSYDVSYALGVRPVINLKADTEITGGIGTKNDPFIVK